MPAYDKTQTDIDDIVSRWANLKLSWRRNADPALWRPGASRLDDATRQTNALTAEIMGVFGLRSQLWWESLAELANLARAKVQQ